MFGCIVGLLVQGGHQKLSITSSIFLFVFLLRAPWCALSSLPRRPLLCLVPSGPVTETGI